MHDTGVPEEGVVIRVNKLYSFNAYKLKSVAFLEKESNDLDNENLVDPAIGTDTLIDNIIIN